MMHEMHESLQLFKIHYCEICHECFPSRNGKCLQNCEGKISQRKKLIFSKENNTIPDKIPAFLPSLVFCHKTLLCRQTLLV